MATARMQMMRTVTAITVRKKRSPGHFRPGPVSAPVSVVLLRGQTTVVSDTLCRFQNANDATPPDARNVTENRKSCEVPSCPSFPQVPKERHASGDIEFLVVRAPAGRLPPAPGSFCKCGVYRRRTPRTTPGSFCYLLCARGKNQHQNTGLIGPATRSHCPRLLAGDSGAPSQSF